MWVNDDAALGAVRGRLHAALADVAQQLGPHKEALSTAPQMQFLQRAPAEADDGAQPREVVAVACMAAGAASADWLVHAVEAALRRASRGVLVVRCPITVRAP